MLNDAAYDYMRKQALSAPTIAKLKAQAETRFDDHGTWLAHLDRLGLTALGVTPDPQRVATEGALWGSVQAHKFLCDGVVLSDDAGQRNVGQHALCWFTRNGWCISWTLSTISIAPRRRGFVV